MKIKSFNNATTFIKSRENLCLIDPWLVGDLYQNSWSPIVSFNDFGLLFKITDVFISHLHKDHWDSSTIKYLNKKVNFFIPNFTFNVIIKSDLEKMGYRNIFMIDIEKWFELNESLNIYFLPPLNSGAQDEVYYKNHSLKSPHPPPFAIDSSLIIKDKDSNTNHLILCDNSPYFVDLVLNHISDLKIHTLWFPFNGYAGDFPLCYDNFSKEEKKEASKRMSRKREGFLLELINEVKPDFLIPHSSDFILKGKRYDEFFEIHEKEFLNRKNYANRIQSKTGIPSFSLFEEDSIDCFEGANIKINHLSKNKIIQIPQNSNLDFPLADDYLSVEDEVQLAVENLIKRIQRYKLPTLGLQDWNVIFQINEKNICLKLDNMKVESLKNEELNKLKKKLKLKTDENILRCLLQRKIHFDNAQIGCYLNWERSPKDEFNLNLYGLLNFLYI